jgi:ankyrin repeat protein
MSSLGGDISRYHIRLRSAHTMLTQASLGLFLYSDDHVTSESVSCFPLAKYAARNWVEHAHFEDVASRVKDGIKTLFDPDKPHFAAWVDMYDNADPWGPYGDSGIQNPLYYSVICGFDDLMEHLAIKHSHYINTVDGDSQNPLLAALLHNRLKAAEFLLEHGANVDARDATSRTILLEVITRCYGHDNLPSMVKLLLKHGADVNARDDSLTNSLHLVGDGQLEVARILLKHKAEVNAHENTGKTPLHALVGWRESYRMKQVSNDHARLLLDYGADVNRRDKNNDTPLHLATLHKYFKIAIIFLGHGVDPNVKNNDGKTPLHILMQHWAFDQFEALHPRIRSRFLSAEEAAKSPGVEDYGTLYQPELRWDYINLAGVLVENGADPNTELETDAGVALLHILVSEKAIGDNFLHLALLFLEHGAEVNKLNRFNETPLHLAIRWKQFKLAELLLEHGADANAEDAIGSTPMHVLSVAEIEIENEDNVLNFAHVLLEHGAEVNRQDEDSQTPLHVAIQCDQCKLAKIFVEHGADPNAEDKNGKTSLHKLSEFNIENEDDVLDLARLLLEHGADVNRRDKHNRTPLITAIRWGMVKLARILVEHGADTNAENSHGMTSLHILTKKNQGDILDLALLLLKHGAEVNYRNKVNETPLHLTIRRGQFKLVGILLEHGADANAENNNGEIPLRLLSGSRNYDEGDFINHARLLLSKNSVGVTRGDGDNTALLRRGIGRGRYKFTQIIIDLSSDATIENNMGKISVQQVSGGLDGSRERLGVAQHSLGCGRGVTVDLNTQDENQMTPIHLQSNVNPFKIATLLLYHGTTLNARRKNGGEPESPSFPEIEGKYYIQGYRVST